MKSSVTCRSCGRANEVETSQAGKPISCGGCGKALTLAAPAGTAGATAQPEAAIRFTCPACGRKYSTKPAFIGKKIRCTGCGAGVRVPGGDSDSAAEPSRVALKTTAGTEAVAPPRAARDRATAAVGGASDPSSLLDDLAAVEGTKRPKHAGAVLPSRSVGLEQARQKAAEEAAVEEEQKVEKAKKKKKKKKKKSAGYFDPKDTLILVGGLAAFVAVLALAAWRFPDFRFPLGGLLCIIGFVVYLLGAAALRQLVAEEGAFRALLFRFCPPYQWWFVLTRWSDTRDYVAFFASGLVILSIGGAIIKLSPAGKEAMESERAYQKAHHGEDSDVPSALSND